MSANDLNKLQEQLDTIFNSLRIHENVAMLAPRPDVRLMYKRMVAKERVQAQELQNKINSLIATKGLLDNV